MYLVFVQNCTELIRMIGLQPENLNDNPLQTQNLPSLA